MSLEKGEIQTQGQTRTQRQGPVKTYKSRNTKACQQTTESWEEAKKEASLVSEGARPTGALISGFWPL